MRTDPTIPRQPIKPTLIIYSSTGFRTNPVSFPGNNRFALPCCFEKAHLLRCCIEYDFPKELSFGAKNVHMPFPHLRMKNSFGAVGSPVGRIDREGDSCHFQVLVIPDVGYGGGTLGTEDSAEAINLPCFHWKQIIFSHAGEIYHIETQGCLGNCDRRFFLGKGRRYQDKSNSERADNGKKKRLKTIHDFFSS